MERNFDKWQEPLKFLKFPQNCLSNPPKSPPNPSNPPRIPEIPSNSSEIPPKFTKSQVRYELNGEMERKFNKWQEPLKSP